MHFSLFFSCCFHCPYSDWNTVNGNYVVGHPQRGQLGSDAYNACSSDHRPATLLLNTKLLNLSFEAGNSHKLASYISYIILVYSEPFRTLLSTTLALRFSQPSCAMCLVSSSKPRPLVIGGARWRELWRSAWEREQHRCELQYKRVDCCGLKLFYSGIASWHGFGTQKNRTWKWGKRVGC